LIKLLFTTKYVGAISTKLNADNLKYLNSIEGIHIDFYNTEYANYDVVLFMGYDFDIQGARAANPTIKIGVIDPRPGLKREPVGADFIIVNGIEMKDWYLKYTSNIFTYYIYPKIQQKLKRHTSSSIIRIGYHGNRWHLHEMYPRVTQALERLADKFAVELWVMYNIEEHGQWDWGIPDEQKVRINHIQWSEAHYEQYLSEVDIGIIPNLIPINKRIKAVWLPDQQTPSAPKAENKLRRIKKLIKRYQQTFFDRARTHPQKQSQPSIYTPAMPYQEQDSDYLLRYKATSNPGRIFVFAQYGIPVIADMFPSALQIIEDGVNGFVCYSTEAWYWALKHLADSPDLRMKFAMNMTKKFDKIVAPDVLNKNLVHFLTDIVRK